METILPEACPVALAEIPVETPAKVALCLSVFDCQGISLAALESISIQMVVNDVSFGNSCRISFGSLIEEIVGNELPSSVPKRCKRERLNEKKRQCQPESDCLNSSGTLSRSPSATSMDCPSKQSTSSSLMEVAFEYPPPVVFSILTTLCRQSLYFGGYMLGNYYIDYPLSRIACQLGLSCHMPARVGSFGNLYLFGTFGACFATLLSYPFDTLRVYQILRSSNQYQEREGKLVAAEDSETESAFEDIYDMPAVTHEIQRIACHNCNIFKILYMGIGTAVCHAAIQNVIAKMLQNSIMLYLPGVPEYLNNFFHLDNPDLFFTRMSLFLGLTVARITLHPLELAKRLHQKTAYLGLHKRLHYKSLPQATDYELISGAYNDGGVLRLYKGWYVGAFETFMTTIGTQVLFRHFWFHFGGCTK